MSVDPVGSISQLILEYCNLYSRARDSNYVLQDKEMEKHGYSFNLLCQFLHFHGFLENPNKGTNSAKVDEQSNSLYIGDTVVIDWIEIISMKNGLTVNDFRLFCGKPPYHHGTPEYRKYTYEELEHIESEKIYNAKQPTFSEDDCSDYDSKEEIVSSRNSHEYVEFRNMVLQRDRYCQCCGYDKNHKHLVVHHIFGFKNYPQLGYNEDNGITLCKWCHERYHSIYGKKNPNPVTFGEYMRKYGRD